jgi:hypothetical protein
VLALACGSLGCGGSGGLKGGVGGTGGASDWASGGASGGGSTGNGATGGAATGGAGTGGAATGGAGTGGAATGGAATGGAATGGAATGGKGAGGAIGTGGVASGGSGIGGMAAGGSAGTVATGGTGSGGTGTGGVGTGGVGGGGAGTGGQASGGTGGQDTTKVTCPVAPECAPPMIHGTSTFIGPDGCISDFCCVSLALETGSARGLLVNGQLTLAIPTRLEYQGMQPLGYEIRATSRMPDEAQTTNCEVPSIIEGPSKLFCPANPGRQPACGETIQLQVDYQWGSIGCYAHTDYSSYLTATVSAEVECLACPARQPATGTAEATLPVGTECLYSNGTTGCQVVRSGSPESEVIWKCAPRAGADAGQGR